MVGTPNIEFLGVDGLNDIEPNYFYPDKESFTINNNVVILATLDRLGNQFFQYAAAYSLAKDTNKTLLLFTEVCPSCYLRKDPTQDVQYHLTKFNLSKSSIIIPENILTSKLKAKFYPYGNTLKTFRLESTPESVESINGLYVTPKNFFNVASMQKEKIFIMASHFENQVFFDKYYAEILEQLIIPEFDITNISKALKEVQKESAVCIHVRGTDYLNHPSLSIPISFQQAAVKFIEENKLIENPNYYIITDDLPYAKEGLKDFPNINYIAEKKGTLEHLYILGHCSNNIMAKSTFSWWGSFLNQRSKFTIVPCSYYDLYKPNHLTYKIQFPVNGTNKCGGVYKDGGYILQYKDKNGNNISEKKVNTISQVIPDEGRRPEDRGSIMDPAHQRNDIGEKWAIRNGKWYKKEKAEL